MTHGAAAGGGALLAGQRAVVTGSTRGLGLAFAEELGQHGARLVLNGRDAGAGAQAYAQLTDTGVEAAFVAGSIADDGVAEELIGTCVDRYGGIDLLVNNAGLIRDRTLLRMTPADFDEVVAVHLRGTWAASRAAAAAMRESGGAILNLVSGSALYGLVGQSNYAAAKGGVLALTRALSLELSRYAIRVNALYPAALTDMTRSVLAAARRLPAGAALPEFRLPQEVAPVVAYLASDAARHLTGQVLSFDGRELTVWSHPAPACSASLERPWSVGDVASAFSTGSVQPEPTHPDRLGQAVRELLTGPVTPAGRK